MALDIDINDAANSLNPKTINIISTTTISINGNIYPNNTAQ